MLLTKFVPVKRQEVKGKT